MTFYPYAGKIKIGDSDELLEIPTLENDRFLVRDGSFISTSLVGADQISNIDFPEPTSDSQIANKKYVDDGLGSLSAAISFDSISFIKLDGSRPMTGSLSLGGNFVQNVADPVSLQDAATKGYVDAGIAAALADVAVDDLNFLKLDGSRSMAGSIEMDGYFIKNLSDPVDLQDAATKKYADDQVLLALAQVSLDSEAFLKVDGSRPMAGSLQMDGYVIVDLGEPLSPSDATTKNYVDTQFLSLLGQLSAADLDFLKLDGSRQMKGSLNIDGYLIQNLGNPFSDKDAANKEYVDQSIEEAVEAALFADLQFLRLDGTVPMAGHLDMDGYVIRGLGAPSLPNDAVNKSYLDAIVADLLADIGLADSQFLRLDGSLAMQGNLDIDGYLVENLKDPVNQQDAATKNYVDLKVLEAVTGVEIGDLLKELAFLRTDGTRPMAGDLNTDGYAIVNLSSPIDPQDAANKFYVDGEVAAALATAAEADLQFLKLDGSRSMAGHLDLDGYSITSVADPVGQQDVATKKYVDVEIDSIRDISAQADLQFLKLDGSRSMAGSLQMDGYFVRNIAEPVQNGDATTKLYVDLADASILDQVAEEDATFLKLDGSRSMQGALSLDGYAITSLGDPIGLQDATTKNYVDTEVAAALAQAMLADLQFLKLDGSRAISGVLNLDGYTIINLLEPADPQDATNKIYVDSSSAAVLAAALEADLQFLKLDGSRAMSGDLDLDGYLIKSLHDPVDQQDATTKNYVDAADADVLAEALLADIQFLKLDGSRPMTGVLNMDGYAVINLLEPASPQDAANKSYVDAQAADALSAALEADLQFLKLDGTRAMAGDLDLDGYFVSNISDPIDPHHAASKKYVDDGLLSVLTQMAIEDAGFLMLDGTRPMTGSLDLDGYLVENVRDPVAQQDAATKKYVDDRILEALTGTSIEDLAFLRLDGSRSMAGNLDMDGYRMVSLANPVDMQDAATKSYTETFASNRHLSNLCPETAINQWLIPNQDLSHSLGAQKGVYGYTTARNWASVLSHEFISAGTPELYLASCSPDMELDSAGRDVHIKADGTGLLANVDGGNIYISTATTSGSGQRGSVYVDAEALDVGAARINNLANPDSPSDAATKEYVDSLARLAVTTKTESYDATVLDRIIFVDASSQEVDITLPSAVGQSGLLIHVKRISAGTNNVYVVARPGETVDGESETGILVQWEAVTVASNGSNWFVV